MARKEPRRSARAKRPPKGRKGVGRRSLIYDEKIVRTFLESVLKGNWLNVAAQVAGISEATVKDWLNRGEAAKEVEDKGEPVPQDDVVYLTFLSDFRRADATAQDRVVGNLSKQTETSPIASMGMLKMRWPKQWREAPTQMEVSGPGGGPIALVPALAQLTDEELAAKAAQLDAEISDADAD